MKQLAVFGGEPTFSIPLNFIRPMFPSYSSSKI